MKYMGLLDHDTLIGINTCTFVFLNIKICKTFLPVIIKMSNVARSTLPQFL